MPLSHSARFVYYDNGADDQNAYALVVGGDLQDDDSHLDLCVLNNNGVWQVHRDVKHSETGGGTTYHKDAL